MSLSIATHSAKGPTTTTYLSFLASLLRKYGKAKFLCNVQHVHTHLITCGLESSTYLRNCLIQGYGDCGAAEDAHACFDFLRSNTYSWTLLIKAFAENGFLEEALNVFRRNPFKDVVTWNSTITLLVHHGCCREALDLFYSMPNEGVMANNVTFLGAIGACITLENIEDGQKVHSAVRNSRFDKNLAVSSALINMYGKWGFVDMARGVFESVFTRDVALWTAMIAAYTWSEDLEEALHLFHQMQQTGIMPDVILCVSLLDMCTKLRALEEGKNLHFIVEDNNLAQDVMVATALINLYGKCAHIHDAQRVFDRLMGRDVVSFNAMITAYEQNDCGEKSLATFYKLYSRRISPTIVTFVCVLEACSSLAALKEGEIIHSSIVSDDLEKKFVIQFALLNMYGKSGSLKDAKNMFSKIPVPNLLTWNSMIASLSHNGESEEALILLHQMQIDGVEPDDATFVSILTACSHSGYVGYGKYVFYCMIDYHSVPYTFGHFLALLDILGRAGRLEEAEALIQNMPLEITGVAWRCLLGACIIHGDEERGAHAASRCTIFEPWNALPFVMMSNLFTIAEHN
ncbi:hypothetical protein GOP47_0017049 [Adiantum capillus-veneris]|uniref:Pentatricopeptide repeat-containing protein n=1 Tax=Adiantum capillus-veneris TaxID=13818 RepID=A0A9D4UIV5_ADICA|nr:hypothetical protein GOP47_0017049 [Adiantum capillus-veneris]